MKPTWTLAVNVVLSAVIVAGGLWAYQLVWGGAASAASATTAPRTATATMTTVTETASTSGTVASSDVVTANFSTNGTVTKIYVKLGQSVRKGETLARIDPTAAKEQLTTAKDNLIAAEDSLATAKDSGDTSAIDSAQAQVDSAKDAVTTAQAQVDGAVLHAPISGTVIAQNGVVGASSSSFSGSGASSSGGSSTGGFMQIADLKRMEVDTYFPEADATKLKTGQRATITWNALPGARAPGAVDSIDPTATTTGNVVTYGVVLKLNSLPSGIRIGQTTTVVITIESKANVLAMPSAAITRVGRTSFVRKEVGGIATRTPVEVGLTGDTLTEITSGLSEGDVVELPALSTSTSTINPFGGGGLGGLGGGGGIRGGGGSRGGAGTGGR